MIGSPFLITAEHAFNTIILEYGMPGMTRPSLASQMVTLVLLFISIGHFVFVFAMYPRPVVLMILIHFGLSWFGRMFTLYPNAGNPPADAGKVSENAQPFSTKSDDGIWRMCVLVFVWPLVR